MGKRRIIFLLLLGQTLIYPLIVNYLTQVHNAEYAAALKEYSLEIQPYIDLPPFTATRNGSLIMLFGAIISVSWILLFLWRK